MLKTIQVAGSEALAELARLRAGWLPHQEFPFIIGNDRDLEGLHSVCCPAEDGGRACLAAAAALSAADWLAAKTPSGGKSWPTVEIPPQQNPHSLYEGFGDKLKARVHIGLVGVENPWDLFAVLGYGDWNDCPEPQVHVALHRHWAQTHGALPLALCGDVVECLVEKPPTSRKEALALARQHYAYCYDIVEQGVGSISKLGSSLLNSRVWYFWWD